MYCSDKCRRGMEAKKFKEKYVPKIRPLAAPRKCDFCGKEFSPDIIHEDQNTCSYKCNYKHRNEIKAQTRRLKREEILSSGRECIVCGNYFIPTTLTNKICSDECRNKLKAIKRKEKYDSMTPEERSQLYRHKKNKRYRSSYEQILARDNGICQICGSSGNTQIHHIDGKGESRKDMNGHREYVKCNHSLKNLITLCPICHKAMHNNLLVKHKGKWYIKGTLFEKLGIAGSIEIWNGD